MAEVGEGVLPVTGTGKGVDELGSELLLLLMLVRM